MVVNGVGLLVQHEAIVQNAALHQPATDAGRVVVNFVFVQLLGSSGGNGVGQEEGRSVGQSAGRDLDDLTAVNLTDDALDEHGLALIAILHERAVLLQQVGELVRAEADPALIGDVLVAQSFHAVEERLVGVALGDCGAGEVAPLSGLCSQSLKHIIHIPTPVVTRRPVQSTAACFHAD